MGTDGNWAILTPGQNADIWILRFHVQTVGKSSIPCIYILHDDIDVEDRRTVITSEKWCLKVTGNIHLLCFCCYTLRRLTYNKMKALKAWFKTPEEQLRYVFATHTVGVPRNTSASYINIFLATAEDTTSLFVAALKDFLRTFDPNYWAARQAWCKSLFYA